MADETDWLYRPLLRGHVRYAELHDGALDLNDIAELNELLDVDAENSARIRKAIENGRR